MKVSKGYYGWTAESAHVIEGKQIVSLLTMKRSNGQLVTTATGMLCDGIARSTVIFQDYHKDVAVSKPGRVTEKAVTAQHESIDILAIMAEVREFYGLA